MGIKNKKEAAEHLNYVVDKINRMHAGNLEHHREAIRGILKDLLKYLRK